MFAWLKKSNFTNGKNLKKFKIIYFCWTIFLKNLLYWFHSFYLFVRSSLFSSWPYIFIIFNLQFSNFRPWFWFWFFDSEFDLDLVHRFILDHKSVDFTILVVNFTTLYCLFYGFTVDFTVLLLNLPFYSWNQQYKMVKLTVKP
jgi:hypothetical protein